MSDPIEDAFKSLHQGNLLAAKDARIKQLEEQLKRLTLDHAFLMNEAARIIDAIKADKDNKANG